jgi:high-affinity iron transporter
LGAFVITLREGFEAALIVSLILAYLAKTGNLERHSSAVWWGVGSAVGFSVVIGAILFASVGELEGTGEAVYEGVAMILAAAVVTWMVFWMRKQAATIGANLREQVDRSLIAGGGFALAAVAFVGVGREGIETALFLFASVGDSGAVVSVIAALLGLAVAVVLGVLLYRGALRLDLKRFFTITGVLVIGFAAWLLFGGLHELGEATESEALESLGAVAAVVYAVGFGWLYLRGVRGPRPDAAQPGAAEPAPATEA